MNKILLAAALALPTFAIAQAPATPANPPPAGHDAHAAGGEIPGLKKELFAGITAADFLKLSDKPKTVKITLVAVFNAANYGMNFNGFSHGKAIYTVPTGWAVDVTFINPSPIPHSAVVVEKDTTRKLQLGEPYFKGGGVTKPEVGIAYNKVDFSFVADEAGEYALACGFPAHAISGHWLAFNVSDTATVPTLQLGADAPAKEAVK